MTTERQIPGAGYVNETGTRQAQLPGGPFVNETAAVGDQTLSQSASFTNSNSLAFQHAIAGDVTLTQATTFTNSNSLAFQHAIVGGDQALTQSQTHQNQNSLTYQHTLSPGRRYWVGGTGNWDAAGTTHWSETSGGFGGASVPTTSDNVYFDANSGASSYTVTMDGLGGGFVGYCLDLTTTAPASGNLTFKLKDRGILAAYGNVSLYAGMVASIAGIDNHLVFTANPNAATLTTNGVNLPWIIQITLETSLTLLDDLSCTGGDGQMVFQKGTFYGNDKNITAEAFLFNNTPNRTLIPGVATWTALSAGWDVLPTSGAAVITITPPANPSDWVLRIEGNSGAGIKESAVPGTRNYGIIDIATTGATASTVKGNITCDIFRVSGIARTVKFGDTYGTTYTLTCRDFQCSGSAGNLNTFAPVIPGYPNDIAPYNFIKTGGGLVDNDYLNLSYCHATPTPNIWYAGANSVDSGNNTGWYFTASTVFLAQSSTYTNSNDLSYQHAVAVGEVTLTQSATHSNGSTWFTHALVSNIILPQGARYDGGQTWYQHSASHATTLTQADIEALITAVWGTALPLGAAPNVIYGASTLTQNDFDVIAYGLWNRTLP